MTPLLKCMTRNHRLTSLSGLIIRVDITGLRALRFVAWKLSVLCLISRFEFSIFDHKYAMGAIRCELR